MNYPSKIDKTLSNIDDISDISEEELQLIKDFFQHYKANEPNKWVKVYDFKNKNETLEFIESKML